MQAIIINFLIKKILTPEFIMQALISIVKYVIDRLQKDEPVKNPA